MSRLKEREGKRGRLKNRTLAQVIDGHGVPASIRTVRYDWLAHHWFDTIDEV